MDSNTGWSNIWGQFKKQLTEKFEKDKSETEAAISNPVFIPGDTLIAQGKGVAVSESYGYETQDIGYPHVVLGEKSKCSFIPNANGTARFKITIPQLQGYYGSSHSYYYSSSNHAHVDISIVLSKDGCEDIEIYSIKNQPSYENGSTNNPFNNSLTIERDLPITKGIVHYIKIICTINSICPSISNSYTYRICNYRAKADEIDYASISYDISIGNNTLSIYNFGGNS